MPKHTYKARCFTNRDYYDKKTGKIVSLHGPVCSNVIYKPSNSKFASQGAVSSSTSLIQKKMNAINLNKSTTKILNTYAHNNVDTPPCDNGIRKIYSAY